jgi:hypothetical protein
MTRERADRLAYSEAHGPRRGSHVLVVRRMSSNDYYVIPVPHGCSVGHVRDVLNCVGISIDQQYFTQAIK